MCLEITKRCFLKSLCLLVQIQPEFLQTIWSKDLCEQNASCKKLAAMIQGSGRVDLRTSSHRSPHGSSSFAVLHFLLKFQFCSAFLSKTYCNFVDDESRICSYAKHKIVILWVSFAILQGSSYLELCKLMNDHNTLDWSIPCFTFWQQICTTVLWLFDQKNSWTGLWCLTRNVELCLNLK